MSDVLLTMGPCVQGARRAARDTAGRQPTSAAKGCARILEGQDPCVQTLLAGPAGGADALTPALRPPYSHSAPLPLPGRACVFLPFSCGGEGPLFLAWS